MIIYSNLTETEKQTLYMYTSKDLYFMCYDENTWNINSNFKKIINLKGKEEEEEEEVKNT